MFINQDQNANARIIAKQKIRRMVGAMVAYATYNRTSLGHIKALLDEPSKNIFREPLLLAEPWGLYLNRLYYDQSGEYDKIYAGCSTSC